jgi:hypothetical protein
LAAYGQPGYELEYKLRMEEGQTLVYSWSVDVPAGDGPYYDFHSQSDPDPKAPDAELKVMSHHEGNGEQDNGSLIAPFSGIHGWYFQNITSQPVTVKLAFAGFYTARPDPYAAE